MSPLMIVLIVILVLLMVGTLPHWPYSAGWNAGYYPSGIILALVILLIVFVLLRV